MYKFELTHAKNIVGALIGLFIAFGIGPLQPYMLLFYGAGCIYLFLTRSKFYVLSIVSTLLTVVLFTINFTYQTGVSGSFAPGSEYVTISIILSVLCVAVYFTLNTLLIMRIIPTKKDDKNVRKRR